MPPTPSAACASFVSGAALLLALTYPQTALAQPTDLGDSDPASVEAAPQEEAPLAPSEGPTSGLPETQRVQITSVGSALSPAALERMLGPELKSSYRLRFSATNHFEPEELFGERAASPDGVRVWVDASAPRTIRIYFVNRDGTRYLVRDLERSNPLNEMDREAIAQTIEWSLQALSEGTAGMTRAEAEALLAEPAEAVSSPDEPEPLPPEPTPIWRKQVDTWLPELALLYRLAPQSEELLGTQGPSLRVGLDHVSARHQLGVTLGVLYQYPRRHTQAGVSLELETLGARLGARYLALGLVTGAGLGMHLGLGFDAVFSSTQVFDRTRFEAAEDTHNIIPLLDAAFVWQQRVEPGVRFELSLGAELELAPVNYDVVTPDGKTTLVASWPARPSASIGVALF